MTGPEFLSLSIEIGFAFIGLSVALIFVRLGRGPSLPDRVVALDMMTVALVAVCGMAAMWSDDQAFMDVALVLALVGFLATVALARFAERRLERKRKSRAEEAREDPADG
ncbi:MAG: cation:proton antiporter [Pseudomonadota bacterium]